MGSRRSPTLDDIVASLKETTVQNKERSRATDDEVSAVHALPPETYQKLRHSEVDLLQEKIDQYLRKDIRLPEIPDRFKDLPTTLDVRPVSHDFQDEALIGKLGIQMERLTDRQMVELGRTVIPMVSSGFSKYGAAAIFTLAYGLKKPGTEFSEYMFNGVEALEHMEDEKYSDYSKDIIVSGNTYETIMGIRDGRKEAALYSFLAASTLRLFTKSPDNFTKAWSHICGGFTKFYGGSIGVMLPTATETAMKSLASIFSIGDRMVITLYRFLYVSNFNEENMGMKRFLYDIHLSYTGMHIVTIVLDLTSILNCSTGALLAAIDTTEWRRQVACLEKLLKLMGDTSNNHKRRMWRYGRIFNETFMSDLQTRRCPRLVYVLASALKMEAPDTHKNILSIAQLSDVSVENQRKCQAAAHELLRMIKMSSGKERNRTPSEGSSKRR